MPAWLSFLLPMLARLVLSIGLPALEKKWPWIIPIADEILKLIGGKTDAPSVNLQASAEHYNALCSGSGCKPS